MRNHVLSSGSRGTGRKLHRTDNGGTIVGQHSTLTPELHHAKVDCRQSFAETDPLLALLSTSPKHRWRSCDTRSGMGQIGDGRDSHSPHRSHGFGSIRLVLSP